MRKLPISLQNTYYLMRHGQSIANKEDIIVSLPEHGCDDKYGLSEMGRQQVMDAVAASDLTSDVLIYASDFSRARQTAELVAKLLGAPEPVIAPELRERCFGELEFASSNRYADVWKADLSGQLFGRGVEDIAEVSDRVVRLIEGLEHIYCNKTILLVSHGDTLQALQVVAQQLHPALDYNKAVYMENAEIKRLVV